MNRERAFQERKCFECGEWKHIVKNCRMKEQKEVVTLQSPNRFEVLRSRVINIGVSSRKKEKKNRKTILREEKQKKKKVEVRKTAK